jgi:hypothetical protein
MFELKKKCIHTFEIKDAFCKHDICCINTMFTLMTNKTVLSVHSSVPSKCLFVQRTMHISIYENCLVTYRTLEGECFRNYIELNHKIGLISSRLMHGFEAGMLSKKKLQTPKSKCLLACYAE